MKPAAPSSRAQRTALLVEDTVSLQMIYRTILSGAGFVVRTAATAAQALQSMQDAPSDVILLDIGLPDWMAQGLPTEKKVA